jgi:subtilisin family serine protease
MPELHSGFITIRLAAAPFLPLVRQRRDLRAVAREAGAMELVRVLDDYPGCAAEPVITSVEPGRILELEAAALKRGSPISASLTLYWRLDARSIDDSETLLKRLTQAAGVEFTDHEPVRNDPAVNPANDPFSALQLYVNPAPAGIDARWAWSQPGGAGQSVAFVDLEQGWVSAHEDLPARFALPGVRTDVNPGHEPHGTAVLGIVAGADNAKGIIGIAPKARQISVASHFRTSDGTEGLVADAIISVVASGHVVEGDVLLLEVLAGNLPIEVDEPVFMAIQIAIGLGLVVVEAAGNFGVDLDTYPALNRQAPATFQDSGAIVVGACMSALDATGARHDRWVFTPPVASSNYGSRVDCHAFGQNVVTTGPARNAGDALGSGTLPTNQYRSDFGGTSAAAAIVAGAAVVLQGMHQASMGTSLSSTQMRQALSTHGTPQGTAIPGHIGMMPDLKKAARGLSLGGGSETAPWAPTNVRIQR